MLVHARDLFVAANGATTAMPLAAEPNQRPATSIRSISGRDVQAVFSRRRHQPRRPPLAKISPGSPAPTTGPGTASIEIRTVTVLANNSFSSCKPKRLRNEKRGKLAHAALGRRPIGPSLALCSATQFHRIAIKWACDVGRCSRSLSVNHPETSRRVKVLWSLLIGIIFASEVAWILFLVYLPIALLR